MNASHPTPPSTPLLDPIFAEAVRAQLAATTLPDSWLVTRSRRRRIGASVLAGAIATVALTAAALVVSVVPGSQHTIAVGQIVRVTHLGPDTVELGTAPAGATKLSVSLYCFTAGTFEILDGDRLSCGTNDIGNSLKILLPVHKGKESLAVTSSNTGQWRVEAQYVNVVTTPWAVNAAGQSYGEGNPDGIPDLSLAQATNGKVGYIYSAEMFSGDQNSRMLNVYKSDGKTIIGKFPLTMGETKTDGVAP